eukprot:Pompholyxophrys_sp_v1_NODE_5_length_12280_cov_3.373988.p5 type:complete len:251 gc:universal NODE_5_length_12280_cov_3.373988:2262-3014(+)
MNTDDNKYKVSFNASKLARDIHKATYGIIPKDEVPRPKNKFLIRIIYKFEELLEPLIEEAERKLFWAMNSGNEGMNNTDVNSYIEDTVSSIIDDIMDKMNSAVLLKDQEKERFIASLHSILLPALYRSILKTDRFKKELIDMSPALIYQPGSRWIPKPELQERFSPLTTKEIYKSVMRDLTSGQKKYYQKWRSFCSQIEELGKPDLLRLVAEMELPAYIKVSPKSKARSWDQMTQREICDYLQKYFALKI